MPTFQYTQGYLSHNAKIPRQLRSVESSIARPPFPYHDPRILREGEREYNDSMNGHPSAYLPFLGITRAPQQNALAYTNCNQAIISTYQT